MSDDRDRLTVTPPAAAAPVEEVVSSGRMILTMGAIGTLSAVLLVATFFGTQPAIERNRAEALQRAVFEVLPGATRQRIFAVDQASLTPAEGEARGRTLLYAGYDDHGELVGVAIPAQGPGFQDTLKVLYGYDPDCQCVVGFKVLESKETPGLGDKIETDPAFTANFEALDLRLAADGAVPANPLALVKPGEKTDPWQVEGITGATISSRAVTRILRSSAETTAALIQNNREVLEHGDDGRVSAKDG